MSHETATGTCAGTSPEVTLHACRESIRKVGWHCIAILAESGTPDYAYTIGLEQTYGHPELVICGLPARAAHGVLTAAVELIERGSRFGDGDERDGIAQGFPLRFRAIPLDRCSLEFHVSDVHYGHKAGRLQVVWPDPDCRFPSDPGCDEDMAAVQDVIAA